MKKVALGHWGQRVCCHCPLATATTIVERNDGNRGYPISMLDQGQTGKVRLSFSTNSPHPLCVSGLQVRAFHHPCHGHKVGKDKGSETSLCDPTTDAQETGPRTTFAPQVNSSLPQCHIDTFSPFCSTQALSSILDSHITQSRLISAHFCLPLNYLTQQASQSTSCPWPHTVPILPASAPAAWLPFPAACKEPTCPIRMCLPAAPAIGTYRRGPGQAGCTPPN